MGKKMKLPFLSKNNNLVRSSSWPWPSCHQPRTLSFRNHDDNKNSNSKNNDNNLFKILNSANLDAETTPESSWFTNSTSDRASFSTASGESREGDLSVETVIRGLRSSKTTAKRLFFEPGETSSILEEAKAGQGLPFKESLVLSMESQDPYLDFRKSMKEMVEAYGLKAWKDLEELLSWYLRVNGKSNHGYIVGAFIDLLVAFAFASTSTNPVTCSSSSLASCSCSRSPSSPLSFYTSSSDDSSSIPCVPFLEPEDIDTHTCSCLSSSLEADEGEIIEEDNNASSSK